MLSIYMAGPPLSRAQDHQLDTQGSVLPEHAPDHGTTWNPLAWRWTPTDLEIRKYRRSWNPLSNGPILLTSVDINPKGQFHTQYFVFGQTGDQLFGNTLTTHRTPAPFALGAVAPTVVFGYGLSDHLELNVALSAIYWRSRDHTGTGAAPSTSTLGVGDTTLYLKNRPMVQDPENWRPSVTMYHQISLPTGDYFGTRTIPGGFSPLGKLPVAPFGSLGFTEGLLFRKNRKPFRVSGGLFYTYTAPGRSNNKNTYVGDIVNTRLIGEYFIKEDWGLAFNLELVSLHGLPYRLDGHDLNIPPTTFHLFGIEPAVQFKLGPLVGATGVLFTIGGQNDIAAMYPNLSLYYYWNPKGGPTMR